MHSAKAKFTNTRAHIPKISGGIAEALKSGGEVDTLVQKHLYKQLYSSKNADGTPRPSSSPKGKKAPATVKAYRKQGWNTENYLVRTGAATTLRGKNSRKGLRLTIKPDGMKVLSYHIPESKHRGKIQWMQLAPNMGGVIRDVMAKAVKRKLK